MREGLGLGSKSRAAYAAIDMGDRQPSEAEAEYLASVFGWPPDDYAEETVEVTPLVAALERQARAIEALVEEMRRERIVQTEGMAALLEGLGSLGATPSRRGTPLGRTPGPRAGTEQ